MEFIPLTKEEVEFVLQESEVLMDFTSFSKMEMFDTNNNTTLGWLIMGYSESHKKSVGIAHRDLQKPLLFEEESDAKKYLKMLRNIVKNV